MITKLQLRNWRSHENTELQFADGTNCFIGHIGSGKTSVLNAICFALFGTFPEIQSKKIRLEDVIARIPKKQNEAGVSLNFVLDGSEWTVTRTIESGRTTAELKKGDQIIESPQPTRVTEEVERLLKINYDLFTRAVYSEQNQLDMFLTIPKGQRMKKIDELLAIDKFEKARQSTHSLVNKIHSRIEEKQRFIDALRQDEGVRRYPFLKSEMDSLENEKGKFMEHNKKFASRMSLLRDDISRLKAQQGEVQKIEEEIRKYKAFLEIAEIDVANAKIGLTEHPEWTAQELERRVKEGRDSLKDLRDALTSDRLELDRIKSDAFQKEATVSLLEKEKLPRLKEQLEEIENISKELRLRGLEKLSKKHKETKSDLEKHERSLQKNLATSEEFEQGIKELKDAGSICPVCDSKLTEKRRDELLKKKEEKMLKLSKDRISLVSDIERLRSDMESLEKEVRELEVLKMKLESYGDVGGEIKSSEKLLKGLKADATDVSSSRKMLEKNVMILERKMEERRTEIEKMENIVRIRNELDSKMQKMKDYSFKLAELQTERLRFSGFSMALLDSHEKELQSLLLAERQNEGKVEGIEALLVERRGRMKSVEGKIKQIESEQNQAKSYEALANQLILLEAALINTQEQLRKNFVSAVNQAMQLIWPELYPYRDFFSIRMDVQEGDYVLQLQNDLGWLPVDGIASGGERSIACLALRVAFAIVLAPQLRLLFLDEPTANLDSSSVDVLSSVLREKVSTIVDQCFIITHDEKLKEAVSGFCYEFKRNKANNEASNVLLVASPADLSAA